MPQLNHTLASLCLVLALVVTWSADGFAQVNPNPETGAVQDLIGYNALAAELGTELPDGSGSSLALVEAFNGGPGNYLPNPASFPEKTINDSGLPPEGETAGVSGHANGSAGGFFGANSSSPASDNIDAFSAGFWLGSGALNFGTGRDPLTQTHHVSNHSYIVTGGTDFGLVEAEELLQRLDYYIDQNDSLVVAGSTNGRSTNLSFGLATSVNVVGVGRTDGEHGAGPTTFYLEGRTKVEIVAPATATSRSTPIVASVASFLVDAAEDDAEAIHVETLKATLFAGATKGEFPEWDRTTTRPIDERYGVGEVNAYYSYKIQEGGQFEGSATLGDAPVGDLGWDYSDSLDGDLLDSGPLGADQSNLERYYRFVVGEDQYVNEVSIALAWNVDISDSGPSQFVFDPVPNLVNLDLELFDDEGNIVDASLSTVDNIEHIYIKDLAPGTYDLRLSGDDDSDFAIAWRFMGSALPGDFSLDQNVDAMDIDYYSGNLGLAAEGELTQLDLDGDGEVTQDDHDLLVTTLIQTSTGNFGTVIGDINLDGETDVLGDAFRLIGNLGKTDSVGYADGDLNADGEIDVLKDAFRLIGNLGAHVAAPSS